MKKRCGIDSFSVSILLRTHMFMDKLDKFFNNRDLITVFHITHVYGMC